ncbi:P-loop containing nucleoside triphosphate hydrolase protein [Phaeosphaeriaceae sp. PMI808]|nr:P-loop containing nucleoside triphosphate hydrolase protein [Phaeosphaeriaceae sp. PMI808]
MHVSRLRELVLNLSMSNSTLRSLPSTIMDATIPGYGALSQLIFRVFGIDVGLIVSSIVAIFGLLRRGQFFYRRFDDYFMTYFTSAIEIEGNNVLYHQILSVTTSEQSDDRESVDPGNEGVLGDQGIFNFEKWASSIPPCYEPNFRLDRFFFDGRTFYFMRQKLENRRNSYAAGSDECMVIRCTSRNTQPIKDSEKRMTSIFRPGLKDRSTPATARWYAARGIPHRRDYLFHGPPGVGKTSLSFALAGIFGLGVYVISLSEVALTEANVGRFFSHLPKRCVVLLEDIDSAGLRGRNEPVSTDPTDSVQGLSDNGADSDDGITKIGKNHDGCSKVGESKSLISLAGLLNIIDGAASHEGHVLIINLIRPGRVDVQVQFTLATHDQIRAIFERMCTVQTNRTKYQNTHEATCKAWGSTVQRKGYVLSSEQVTDMATQFANLLPEDTFSPAEIQGYLLRKRMYPSGALREVRRWRNAQIEAKKKGKKAFTTL